MLKTPDVLRFVTSLLPTALEAGAAHRVVVSFNAAVLLDFIGRSTQNGVNGLDAGALAMLVPAFTAPLKLDAEQRQTAIHRDAIVRPENLGSPTHSLKTRS